MAQANLSFTAEEIDAILRKADGMADGATDYKTLVDVTLDDTNSGTNVARIELPLEDFSKCNEYITCIEFPVTSDVSNVNIGGFITDENQVAYAICILYNNSNIVSGSGSSGKYRVFSQTIKNKTGFHFSTAWQPSSYTGANSAGTNARSIIELEIPVSFDAYPPYLRIILTNHTFPSGARIIMEGR